jgi:putative cell wall-binding protein
MGRSATELRGLREIRTMTSSQKRSIPRVQSSAYLDLYILSKEKDRLEKEVCNLDKRKKSIQKRLDEINAEMDRLQKAETERPEGNIESIEKPSGKDWKTLSLNY